MAITKFGSPWLENLPRLLQVKGEEELTHRQVSDMLLSYYLSNGMYQEVRAALVEEGFDNERLKPLRNPTSRAIEFYVSHVWPGLLPEALPIETENDAILEPIEQVWKWSNWNLKKSLAVRWGSLHGDLFIKVETNETEEEDADRVRMTVLDPRDITDVEQDDMGNITFIRIDVPYVITLEDGTEEFWYYTEVWDNEGVRTWDLPEEDWGEVLEEFPIPDSDIGFEELGFDFIPIAQGQAFDLGEKWGLPTFWTSIDKIDELNRIVTALHMRLFRYNKPIHALQSDRASGGRDKAVPPPIFVKRSGEQMDSEGTLTLGEDSMLVLPRGSQLSQLVPDLDYDGMLNVIKDMQAEIENDLPELKYARLHEMGELSGLAIRLMLSDAIDRVKAVRGNFEDTLVRAHKMALTLGQQRGVFETNLGTFEEGAFEHTFRERDVIPLTEKEKAEVTKTRIESEIPLEIALKWEGKTDAEIEEVMSALERQQTAQQQQLASAVLNAQRQANTQAAEGNGLEGQNIGAEANAEDVGEEETEE